MYVCHQKGDDGAFPLSFVQVVLFGFKPSVSEERKRAIAGQFEGLAETIPQVQSFEWGTDVSIENKAEGFTHAFLLTFHSQKDRTAYVDSEAHQAFVRSNIPDLDKLIIIDYLPKSVKVDPRPFL